MYTFRALIEQQGENAPVLVIQHNSFPGNVTASRNDAGQYAITLPMSFDYGTVFAMLTSQVFNHHVHAWHGETGPTVSIRTVDLSTAEPKDDGLVYGQILIIANP